MMIQTERKIRPIPGINQFNTTEIDPMYFGESQQSVIMMINEINVQLEATRQIVLANSLTGGMLCLYMLMFIIFCPLCIVIVCIESRRSQRLMIIMQEEQMKMMAIINKYTPKLHEQGMNCRYGVDTEIYPVGVYHHNHMHNHRSHYRSRVDKIPYLAFSKMGQMGGIQMMGNPMMGNPMMGNQMMGNPMMGNVAPMGGYQNVGGPGNNQEVHVLVSN
jgi:hypothetical protein